MERVVLLQTQLVEATSFSLSKNRGHTRLAVILLDNFIEIQLSELIKTKFLWDGIYNKKSRKYNYLTRKETLKNYDKLLKISVEEKIISKVEENLLSFCHDIRNNLYHNKGEENILIEVALIILHTIIRKYQSDWKSAKIFTIIDPKAIYPYRKKKKPFFEDSKEQWEDFLKIKFNYLNKSKKNPSRLLFKYLLEKIRETKDSIKFLKSHHKPILNYFKNTNEFFNYFLFENSFYYIYNEEIIKIQEIKDEVESKKKYNALKLKYRQNYRYKSENRIKELEVNIKKIKTLELEKSLEKFISLKNEVLLLNYSFRNAAAKIEQEIQDKIDLYKNK